MFLLVSRIAENTVMFGPLLGHRDGVFVPNSLEVVVKVAVCGPQAEHQRLFMVLPFLEGVCMLSAYTSNIIELVCQPNNKHKSHLTR